MVKIFRFDADNHITCNTYIIGKIGNYCLVVDMGSTSDEIYQYVSTHYEKCLGILLTHAHFDHIRGLNKFIKHFPYEVPIYMNQADSALLNDSIANESRYHQEDVKININPIFVQDEEELMFKKDIKVKVITTPFHTEGSVCYLFDDDNALFSGDTLFKGSIGRSDMNASDPSKISSSLKKLLKVRDTIVVYPGHGDITRMSDEKQFNPFLKELLSL